MASALILGANGFVGRALVTRLSQEGSWQPIAMVRAPGRALAGVDCRVGDATDRSAVRAALAGVTHAVNCIAGSAEAMVRATQALCEEARAVGGVRVVHLSSMAVYGEATGLVDETHALDGAGGDYARAKVTCERIVAEHVAAGGDAVILRPGCIHGPGSPQWTTRIARLLRSHRLGDLGPAGDGACNLTFIDDMVRAVVAAAERPAAAGQAFNVSDPAPGTWNAYFLRFGRALGAVPVARISPRWLKLETKLLAPSLKIAGMAAARARLRLTLPELVPPSLARLWRQDIVLDHRHADAVLGFVRTPPAEAIDAAAAWVRRAG